MSSDNLRQYKEVTYECNKSATTKVNCCVGGDLIYTQRERERENKETGRV